MSSRPGAVRGISEYSASSALGSRNHHTSNGTAHSWTGKPDSRRTVEVRPSQGAPGTAYRLRPGQRLDHLEGAQIARVSAAEPAEVLGWRTEEVLGRNMHALIHHTHGDGRDYPEAECPIFNAFRQGLPCRIDDEVLWRADGTSFWAEYSSYPVIEHGEVPKLMAACGLDASGIEQAILKRFGARPSLLRPAANQ